jgi:hypothetical protein
MCARLHTSSASEDGLARRRPFLPKHKCATAVTVAAMSETSNVSTVKQNIVLCQRDQISMIAWES